MNRTFTISFEFEGKTYLALASIKEEKNDDAIYAINIYNTALYNIFPDGTLRYSNKGLEFPAQLERRRAKPLFECIDKSVHEHLQLARQYE